MPFIYRLIWNHVSKVLIIAPAVTCIFVCAFNSTLAQATGMTIRNNGSIVEPNKYTNAVTGPVIPEACILIFHLKVIAVKTKLLTK